MNLQVSGGAFSGKLKGSVQCDPHDHGTDIGFLRSFFGFLLYQDGRLRQEAVPKLLPCFGALLRLRICRLLRRVPFAHTHCIVSSCHQGHGLAGSPIRNEPHVQKFNSFDACCIHPFQHFPHKSGICCIGILQNAGTILLIFLRYPLQRLLLLCLRLPLQCLLLLCLRFPLQRLLLLCLRLTLQRLLLLCLRLPLQCLLVLCLRLPLGRTLYIQLDIGIFAHSFRAQSQRRRERKDHVRAHSFREGNVDIGSAEDLLEEAHDIQVPDEFHDPVFGKFNAHFHSTHLLRTFSHRSRSSPRGSSALSLPHVHGSTPGAETLLSRRCQ